MQLNKQNLPGWRWCCCVEKHSYISLWSEKCHSVRLLVWVGRRWRNMFIAATLFPRGSILLWALWYYCMLNWHAPHAFVKLPDKERRLTGQRSHCFRLTLWELVLVLLTMLCVIHMSRCWKSLWCVAMRCLFKTLPGSFQWQHSGIAKPHITKGQNSFRL